MSSQFAFGGISITVQLAIIVGMLILAVIRGVLAFLDRRMRQLERTHRLEVALDGVGQEYRESVIRACGELENGEGSA
jgi:hypothetical protein